MKYQLSAILGALTLLSATNVSAVSLCELQLTSKKGDSGQLQRTECLPSGGGDTGTGTGSGDTGTGSGAETEQYTVRYVLESITSYQTPFLAWYDEEINHSCPPDMFVTGIYSEHDNYYEDRRFKFTCAKFKTKATATHASLPITRNEQDVGFGYGPNNDWDEDINFTCPQGKFIVGMKSTHHNYFEDRTFNYICASMQVNNENLPAYTPAQACRQDQPNNLDMPGNNVALIGAIVGVHSVHSNQHEDRQTYIKYCDSIFED
ncbi:MAG: hypothetical protein HRT35_12790 [Algicola sp.]|nr:hypothetical protein [Algicola sp.]